MNFHSDRERCQIWALIFGSYAWSTRLYDDFPATPDAFRAGKGGDLTMKAFTCGSFAGLVQAVVICPTEHVKCRLQTGSIYKGPVDATRAILAGHSVRGLFRGWYATIWREVPAFGVYFAFYDYSRELIVSAADHAESSSQWAASALAGGSTGALTWALIYPMDVVKTRIQTMPIDAPVEKRRISSVFASIIEKHGWRRLFRGLGATLLRGELTRVVVGRPLSGLFGISYLWFVWHSLVCGTTTLWFAWHLKSPLWFVWHFLSLVGSNRREFCELSSLTPIPLRSICTRHSHLKKFTTGHFPCL